MRLPDPDGSRAVVVGALPGVPAVRDGVADLVRILTSPDGTGLPAEHCAVVVDEPGLGDRVATAAREAEDLLLFYYAGHGVADARGNLHLTLPSTDPRLPFAAVREAFGRARARHRVVVLDCRVVDWHLAAGQLDVADTVTLTATTWHGTAPGALTGELVTLLTDGDAEGAELLTFGHLHRRLRRLLGRRGVTAPGRDTELLALAPNHAPRLPPEDVVAKYAAHVRAWTRSHGPDHPDVLALRDEHAHTVGEAGSPAEAAYLYAALADDAARVLGRHHPQTSRAREHHASWTARAGDTVGAARLPSVGLTDRTAVTRVGPRRVGRP
ncbi:hypothetical protein [Actinophytocola oryzae]|uniref:Caspase domain-containing protein n=1 Tax=Actinophytocola oryzae TaxID=502181 RepID=A0A4R7W4Q1_9PSEU|nr:hypothetical protein [Actinophytocola oryzae]TDV57686.1 hypothetical protein CLV71_101559 [Actinophytocola oryzae]